LLDSARYFLEFRISISSCTLLCYRLSTSKAFRYVTFVCFVLIFSIRMLLRLKNVRIQVFDVTHKRNERLEFEFLSKSVVTSAILFDLTINKLSHESRAIWIYFSRPEFCLYYYCGKISELEKYISYCTQSYAITSTYYIPSDVVVE